jgi:hypothetical protein
LVDCHSKTSTANNNKEDRKNGKTYVPTQEKMLVEAVQITELENAKWIHTRQCMAAQDTSSITGSKVGVAGAKQKGAPAVASDTTSSGRHKYN